MQRDGIIVVFTHGFPYVSSRIIPVALKLVDEICAFMCSAPSLAIVLLLSCRCHTAVLLVFDKNCIRSYSHICFVNFYFLSHPPTASLQSLRNRNQGCEFWNGPTATRRFATASCAHFCTNKGRMNLFHIVSRRPTHSCFQRIVPVHQLDA